MEMMGKQVTLAPPAILENEARLACKAPLGNRDKWALQASKETLDCREKKVTEDLWAHWVLKDLLETKVHLE